MVDARLVRVSELLAAALVDAFLCHGSERDVYCGREQRKGGCCWVPTKFFLIRVKCIPSIANSSCIRGTPANLSGLTPIRHPAEISGMLAIISRTFRGSRR